MNNCCLRAHRCVGNDDVDPVGIRLKDRPDTVSQYSAGPVTAHQDNGGNVVLPAQNVLDAVTDFVQSWLKEIEHLFIGKRKLAIPLHFLNKLLLAQIKVYGTLIKVVYLSERLQ